MTKLIISKNPEHRKISKNRARGVGERNSCFRANNNENKRVSKKVSKKIKSKLDLFLRSEEIDIRVNFKIMAKNYTNF